MIEPLALKGKQPTGNGNAADEQVILVTPDDVPVGIADKTGAHERGLLHRAFSVFVFSPSGEWLLQRRATGKYHSAGLWSNTCCSHPRPGEKIEDAAHRRLQEEMGFDCPLESAFSFLYRAPLDGGMIEHEFDHVFVGVHAGDPDPDPEEVGAWRWATAERVHRELAGAPHTFTHWFALAFEKLSADGRTAAGAVIAP